jgi:hypothetical protein
MPDLADIAPEIQKPGVSLHQARVDGGTALPRVLWNKHEDCRDPVGACCSQQAPTTEGAPGASSLGVIFSEYVPQAGPGCLVVSASASAVDPQIHHKWVWAFINAMANLVDVVVSKIAM